LDDLAESFVSFGLSTLLTQISWESLSFAVLVELLIVFFLLGLSGLVSASEIAFFSLSKEQVTECGASSKPTDRIIAKLLDKSNFLLATILILNNLINVAIVTLSTFLTWQIFGSDADGWVLFALTMSITVLIVFFGEMLPKVLATQKPLVVARLTSRFLWFFTRVFRPFAWFLVILGRLIQRFTKKYEGYKASIEELNQAVEITANSSSDSAQSDKEIIKGIVNFGSTSVKHIMRSRLDITAIDIETDFEQLVAIIMECNYSRIPIYKNTIDHIEGILYIKDLLPFLNQPKDFNWQNHIRTHVFYIHESKKIDGLFKDFQQKRVHMAIVVDEYGGTCGLITLEDIIEEIVGEINDEFDEQDIFYKKIREDMFVFEGKISMHDFSKIIGVDVNVFNEVRGESESLGGMLLELTAGLPSAGAKIDFQNYQFTVLTADKKRIKTVRVQIQNPDVEQTQNLNS